VITGSGNHLKNTIAGATADDSMLIALPLPKNMIALNLFSNISAP
jgi:hypothetical protein